MHGIHMCIQTRVVQGVLIVRCVQAAQMQRSDLQPFPDRRQCLSTILFVFVRRRHFSAPSLTAIGTRVQLRRVLAERHDA